MVTNVAMGQRYRENDWWTRCPTFANVMIESKTKDLEVRRNFVFVRTVIDDVAKIPRVAVLERQSHSFDKYGKAV